LRTKISFRLKWNCGDHECSFKQILKYKKTISQYIINFQYFYFMKTENKKSNQTCFQNSNILKMKTVFKKWKQKMKMQIKHLLLFSFSSYFLFSFSLKMFSKIQLNIFLSSFTVFTKNKNRKQSNQTFLIFPNVSRTSVIFPNVSRFHPFKRSRVHPRNHLSILFYNNTHRAFDIWIPIFCRC